MSLLRLLSASWWRCCFYTVFSAWLAPTTQVALEHEAGEVSGELGGMDLMELQTHVFCDATFFCILLKAACSLQLQYWCLFLATGSSTASIRADLVC